MSDRRPINPYVLQVEAPVDTLLTTTSGSFVFFTGVNIAQEINKCNIDEKFKKTWTETIKNYESFEKKFKTAKKEYDSALEKSSKSDRAKLLQSTEAKKAVKDDAEAKKDIALDKVKQVLQKIKVLIEKFKSRNDEDNWKKLYNLFLLYKPSDLEDISMPPEPPSQEKTQNNVVLGVRKEFKKPIAVLQKEKDQQRQHAEIIWKEVQKLEKEWMDAQKEENRLREEWLIKLDQQKKNNQTINPKTQNAHNVKMERQEAAARARR